MYTHIAYLSTELNARPVGVRIVEPPPDTRQAVRGNLYAVIEHPDANQSQLVEQAFNVIQRTYYTVKGTQTFVLTETLREAMAIFPKAGSAAGNNAPGILLMALIGDRLTAVGTGPVVALLTAGHNVDVYPPYVTGAENSRGDANRATPPSQQTLDFYRQEIAGGGTIMLAGQHCLQQFTLRELASIVAYVTEENVADVAHALRSQAGNDVLTGIILVVLPDDAAPTTPPAGSQRKPVQPASDSSTRSPLQRTRRTSFPGALAGQTVSRDAAPPVATAPVGEAGSDPDFPAEVLSAVDADGVAQYGDDPQDNDTQRESRYDTRAATGTARQASGGALGSGLLAAAQGAMVQVRSFVDGILPDLANKRPLEQNKDELHEDESHQYEEHEQRDGGLPQPEHQLHPEHQQQNRAFVRGEDAAVQAPLVATPALPAADEDADRPSADTSSGTPEDASAQPQAKARPQVTLPQVAMGRRARIFALVALLILLITVVVVATVFWTTGRTNIAAADELLARAEASYMSAQNALEVGDEITARLNLMDAQAFIAEANGVVGTPMERADQLNARVEQQLADLLQVQPLHALTLPLVRFPAAAQPQRVVVSEQDIYILDTGRKLVQYYALDPTQNIVAAGEGETILAQGDVIDNVTVGRLVDIAWLPAIAGVQDRPYLLILDGNNRLFRYDRRVEGASYIELGGSGQLVSPVQMKVYFDRLYIADAGANQIFRYERGNFATAPSPWLDADRERNLSTLRAMAIDGSIWLLFNEGLLSRFDAGNQVQFSLENSFGQIEGPVDLAVGSEGTSLIYVADGPGERILVFNKNGEYLRQLRAPEGDALRNLRGLFVDEVSGVMYILTQSSLFQHPVVN